MTPKGAPLKTVLGLVASPRKFGNCEMMVRAISKEVPEPHELKLLRMNDFEIGPCRACYRCLFEDGRCPLGDDLDKVLEAILAADGLVVAAPTYFLGANAALKRFLDRGLSFYARIDRLWAKPAVGIGIAGIPGREGYTRLAVQSFLKLLLTDVKGVRIAYGALPGEVFRNEGNEKTAEALGNALFGPALPPAGPSCPLCGGDTFRFLDARRVQCMLCSNTGTMETGAGGPTFAIAPGPHELFSTREAAVAHLEWLRGMKERFLEERAGLKSVGAPYRKGGDWILP